VRGNEEKWVEDDDRKKKEKATSRDGAAVFVG